MASRFTKMIARRLGVNPVWYVEFSPGGTRPIANALNRLTEAAYTNAPRFDDFWRAFPVEHRLHVGAAAARCLDEAEPRCVVARSRHARLK